MTAIDPIIPELLRARLEAIGQEAGAAVQQTAISPIVTESKDYSVTILDAEGAIVCAHGLVDLHFGAVMHAVRSTIALHGTSIAEGDVFLANDPHSGGGLHPQDVVIQRPVYVDGVRVAWVALAAHMMDMGGMVPGSSAPMATECYQEALRLPPVRLIAQRVECADIWAILRTNIRSSDLVEMDMRSLVIGGAVAEAKLVELVREMGRDGFVAAGRALVDGAESVLRARIGALEDGVYRATAWIEYGDDVLRMPCEMRVNGDRLVFDLTGAPPQVPKFFNSKPYIVRAMIAPRLRQILAPGLPFNQSALTVTEIESTPGTLVDCTLPAPIAAAHTDACMAVNTAAAQCLQLALQASPDALHRDAVTAPLLAAYGTGRWTYLDERGARRVYTLIDGAFCGSPAAAGRDGIDIKSSLMPGGNQLEFADVEMLEAAYPVLFRERKATTGFHGYGRQRSGTGCEESFTAHGTETLQGNMTGTRAWFPTLGSAGGFPGATMRFAVRRVDGTIDPVGIHQVGVSVAPGDRFEMICASGGGHGDPLDRDVAAVAADLAQSRVDPGTASAVYGAVIVAGTLDEAATAARREAMRRERLAQARAAARATGLVDAAGGQAGDLPLHPGVVQRGNRAVAVVSGAVLAVAPGNWLDGCPLLDARIDERVGGLYTRAHLDPLTGRTLHVDVIRAGDPPCIAVMPARWVKA
ncbi:MAG: hydantoinase B/oxoprolinase family protein [Sphingomonadales bacterium]|nr:hydantoinase B/oxoprolinase family protein [Sphingomonadales bacterium]